MAPRRAMAPLLVVAVALVAVACRPARRPPPTSPIYVSDTAPCAPHEAGLWVNSVGEEERALADVRYPRPDNEAYLRGYPRPARAPIVEIYRPSARTVPERPAVVVNRCGWTALLPALRPNEPVRLRVVEFHALNDNQRTAVADTFFEMVRLMAVEVADGRLSADPAVMTEAQYYSSVSRLLNARLPGSRTFADFVVRRDTIVTDTSLTGLLIRGLATRRPEDAAIIPRMLREYRDAMNTLAGLLDSATAVPGRPPALARSDRLRVQTITRALRGRSPAWPAVTERDVAQIVRSPSVLPFSPTDAAILRRLAALRASGPRRVQVDAAIALLATPVDRLFPNRFAEQTDAAWRTVRIKETTGALVTEDVRRWFGVGYAQGFYSRRSDDGERAVVPRGALTVTFSPFGTQVRSPRGMSGRFALLGGVTAEGDPDDRLLLAGGALRINRYLLLTAAGTAPHDGGGGTIRCCFLGLGAELPIPQLR